PMRDAIFLRKPAGIDEPFWNFGVFKLESQIDASARSRLDLRKDVLAIEWDHGLAGTHLHVFSQAAAESQQLVIDRAQSFLRAGVHLLNVLVSLCQIGLRSAVITFAHGALSDPRCVVPSAPMLLFEPGAALFLGGRPFFFHKFNPLIQRASGLLLQSGE